MSAALPSELETTAMRRVTMRLLPFLMVGYFFAFIDRVNVGFAGKQMSADLHFSGTVFGLGASIFFLGYFLFEVPSNLALERVGARRWIARIMVTWGILSGATAFVTGPISFQVMRFLLGCAEAGFFPGIILYLTFWFPAAYRARIVAIFMVAIPASAFIGSPISGLILDLNGMAGLAGWQWLFLLEAIPTVLLGVFCLFWLPDGPAQAAWLPESERDWLATRLAEENKAALAAPKVPLWRVMSDKRVLVLALTYMGSSGANYGITFWQPQIIQNHGLTNVQTGLLNALPYLVGSVAMIWWGRRSDRRRERVWHTAISLVVCATGLAACTVLSGLGTTMAALTLSLVGAYMLKGPFWALSSEWLGAAAAAAGLAQINAIGNLGGLLAPWAIGVVKDATGNPTLGLLPLVGITLAGAIGVVAMSRGRGRAARLLAAAE